MTRPVTHRTYIALLGMLMFPAWAIAQTVKEADVVGGWKAEVEHADNEGKSLGTLAWLVLWPDGLWGYGGALMNHLHGGARWRMVGDTLWLANDYFLYYHTMIENRLEAIGQKGYGYGVMDKDIINKRQPYPVPDSVYWSKTFRDTASGCAGGPKNGCGIWVYKVSKKGQQLHLARLDSLSRVTWTVATKAVLTRDTLVNCRGGGACDWR